MKQRVAVTAQTQMIWNLWTRKRRSSLIRSIRYWVFAGKEGPRPSLRLPELCWMVRLLYFQNVHLLSLALMNAWERLVAFLEFRLSARVGPKSKCVNSLRHHRFATWFHFVIARSWPCTLPERQSKFAIRASADMTPLDHEVALWRVISSLCPWRFSYCFFWGSTDVSFLMTAKPWQPSTPLRSEKKMQNE